MPGTTKDYTEGTLAWQNSLSLKTIPSGYGPAGKQRFLLHDQSLNKTNQKRDLDPGVPTLRPDSLSYFSNLRYNERASKPYEYFSTPRPCSAWGSSLGFASLNTFIFWVCLHRNVQLHRICSVLLKSHIGLETQNAHTSFGESLEHVSIVFLTTAPILDLMLMRCNEKIHKNNPCSPFTESSYFKPL